MSETLILPPPSVVGESHTDGPPLFLLPARDAVERLLTLARMHLGMEVAIVSEFTGEEQVLRHLEGDPEAFGLQIGAPARLSETYCWGVANGHLPPVVHDARADVRVRDLGVRGRPTSAPTSELRSGSPTAGSTAACAVSATAPAPPSETGTPIS
jgi:hypothetical protein